MKKKRSINQKYSQNSLGKLTSILDKWVVNELSKDFGIDLDVRICSEFSDDMQDVSTASFYVQLKSTNDPCISEPYHDLSVVDINFFVGQGIPVVLIKYFVKCDKFYWEIIQTYVWDTLDIESPDWSKKKVKRIKLINQLNDLQFLENQIIEAKKRIARHQVLDMGICAGISIKELGSHRNKNLQEYKLSSLLLADESIKTGDFNKVKELFEDVASTPGDDEYKLNAILNLIFQKNSINLSNKDVITELCDKGITLSERINAKNFLYLFKILKDQTLLVSNISRLSSVLSSREYEQKYGDNIFQHIHQSKANSIYAEYLEVVKSINESTKQMVECGYYKELLVSLSLLIEAITFQIQSFSRINPEFADACKKGHTPLISTFIELLKRETDPVLLQFYHFKLGSYFYWSGNPSVGQKAMEAAIQYAGAGGYIAYLPYYEMCLRDIKEHPNPFEIPKPNLFTLSFPEIKEYTTEHLKMCGINFEKPDQDTIDYIIPALDDFDPTSFFKYCENIRISYLSISPMGRTLGLQSMGLKAIWCKNVGGQIGSDLKMMFNELQSSKCNSCKYRKERQSDWICTIPKYDNLNRDPDFQDSIHKAVCTNPVLCLLLKNY